MRRFLQLTLVAFVLVGLGQLFWQYGQLPARVATHFDAQGRPNGWLSREAHLTQAIVFTLIVSVGLSLLSLLIARIPAKWINLPNRDYWLDDSRRATSLAWLSNLVLGTGCAVVALIDVVFYGVYRANLNASPRFEFPLALLLGVFAAVLIGLVGATLFRFRRPAP